MLSSVLASSAVALAGLLIAAPRPVDALVTPPGSGSGLDLAARHLAGVSPNHNALARRKRNMHKNRKRCQQRAASTSSPPSADNTPPPANYNSGGASTTTTTPPLPAVTQAPTPPPTNSGGTGKLILAWPNGADDRVPLYFTGKAKYYYTWSPFNINTKVDPVKFCPMLWGWNQIYDFDRLVVRGYADCVLGMNEPNQVGQADIAVSDGIKMWDDHIGHLANEGYTILGSPAPTSAPDGLTWLTTFFQYVGVKPTHICLHWYDVGFDNFQSHVTNYYTTLGPRPVWITEFACQNFNGGPQCTMQQTWDFVTRAAQWMDATSWIDGYAPFGFMREMQGVEEVNRLMIKDDNNKDRDGTPTDLGNWYIWSS